MPAERPRFELDGAPFYRAPEGRRLGSVIATACGPGGRLWILHQFAVNYSGTEPTAAQIASRLRHVVEFDADGEFVKDWGGPDWAPPVNGVSQWPQNVENLTIDEAGDLWVFGYGADDHAVLRFSQNGELKLRIGERGRRGDDADTAHLGTPTDCYHDVAGREVFIADGYKNHRIIAFNSDTGEFTRQWGAYAKDPTALSAAEGFGNPVHHVSRGPDGLIYVADRIKNRVQCFEVTPMSVGFVREVTLAPGTLGFGSAFDLAFSPCGRFMYVADGTNNRVWIVEMASFQVLGWTGSYGETFEGTSNAPAYQGLIHRISIDREGNLLLSRTLKGVHRLKLRDVE
jgi:hypothetical protein